MSQPNASKEQEYIPFEEDYNGPDLELPEQLSDRLQQNQKIRTLITSRLTSGGTKIPRTDEELKMLLNNMRDQDSVTLGEMKVKVEASSKGTEELVRQTMLELQRTRGRSHLRPPEGVGGDVRRVIPASPELDNYEDSVPDQTLIGQQSLNYEEFNERFGKK